MKQNENLLQVKMTLKTLKLYDSAIGFHDSIIPLLPHDEKTAQNEWFSRIKSFTSAFKYNVMRWLNEDEKNPNCDTMSNSSRNDYVATDVPHFEMKDVSQADQNDVCQVQVEATGHITLYKDL